MLELPRPPGGAVLMHTFKARMKILTGPSSTDTVASATGVPVDHVRRFHDHIVSEIVSLARAAGIYAKGGHTGTCKGIFSKCMDAYHLHEDRLRLLQSPPGVLIPTATEDELTGCSAAELS